MKIEVWSDFVCPFCYIGKRRMETALEDFPHKEKVCVVYKSYELDPDADRNPEMNMHELIAKKFGMSVEKAKKMNEDIGKQAEEVGLTYNFDHMKSTNTFDAHRLAQYAAKHGKGKEITERLLYAYFTESKLISNHETLIELANEEGLDPKEVGKLLELNKYANVVREDEDQAQQIGVQGVPFFVFNEKYAVSGAQSTEAFKEVLEKVWEEESKTPEIQSLTPKNAETTYCTDEGCK